MERTNRALCYLMMGTTNDPVELALEQAESSRAKVLAESLGLRGATYTRSVML